MKTAKLAALARQDGYIKVCRVEGGGVWLKTKSGIYRADGMPMIRGIEQIRAVLDMTPAQINKIFVEEGDYDAVTCIDGHDLSDVAEGDEAAEELQFSVLIDSFEDARALKGVESQKLVLYDKKLLAPLQDIIKTREFFEMRLRGRMIVLCDGLFTLGMIAPIAYKKDRMADKIAEFLELVKGQGER